MKRIILIMMATFFMGGLVMAQHARRGDKMSEPKVRAERMTERMVKEYSLNDSQKKQLLEANLALVEKMGDMPMHRRPDVRKGKKGGESCTCDKTDKHHKKADNVAKKEGKKNQLTDEQRAQKKAEMEKKREEMKVARTDYAAQLQKIMTKDQYAAYTKSLQDKKAKMDSRKKEAKQI